MVKLYCGVSETAWNKHPVACGEFACVSPVKGASVRTKAENRVYVPDGTKVLQDSGAFQDSWGDRLSFQEALIRQIAHAEKYDYADKIEYRVSYDLLIDEVWKDGQRTKKRWTVDNAESAVTETVAAAKFLSENRQGLSLCLSAQGVNAKQYLSCVEQVVSCLDPNRDMLGLGGWCIIGKMPKVMMPVFRDTIKLIIPYVAKQGVKKAHIFGVIYPTALGELAWMCNQHDIELSTDSASPALHPVFGEWGYGEWRDNSYNRVPTSIRGIDRARHVRLTREWLARLQDTQWYKEPKYVPDKFFKSGHRQLALAI